MMSSSSLSKSSVLSLLSSDKEGVLFVIMIVVHVEGQVVGELMSILDVDSVISTVMIHKS